MMARFQDFRLSLLMIAWVMAVVQIIWGEAAIALANIAVGIYALYLLLTLPLIKRGSVLIISFLLVLGVLTIHHVTWDDMFATGRFVLIFAGLVPTMILAKSTASTMPSVQRTQNALAQLPPESSAAGLQLAGHAFGGVINTGTFAMLSAALSPSSSSERRRIAALAALRGMNASAVWSPFFVAFAIGQSFIEPSAAWPAIAVGAVLALAFHAITLPIFTPGLTLAMVRVSLSCLKPVSMRLIVVLLTVLGVALLFNFTALSAVVVVIPGLVVIQFFRQPQTVSTIVTTARDQMKTVADDIVVISAAMILGFLVTRTDGITTILALFTSDTFPAYIALIL
ncbi:MAG: hypothetical protein J4F41_06120, partial [Alphaproteobacteria bacterium]|nr:hypothetical protein [Alphaproteobacteria bacterium]